ncbi:hypothetical protein [Herpetosiphon sp. NSE202]|uniref:hypothetical protein n=1 Tax=Herpetosiphon sp. NSE202 TaxID=3351349 RepID=UPI00364309CF
MLGIFKRTVQLFVGICLVVTLGGCGSSVESLVEGRWSDGSTMMEFNENGTLVMTHLFGKSEGYWKASPDIDDHIDVQFSGVFMTFASGTWGVNEGDNDTLIVTLPDNNSFVLRKFEN